MLNQFSRTELLFGEEALKKLKNCRVAVFGVGGVGGYTVEALARSGIGTLDIIDDDKFSITNINRQLHATFKTVGQYKVDVIKERIYDINPEAKVNAYKAFFTPETSEKFDFSCYDYVVDAIDTVTGKIEIIKKSKEANVPVISSMGTGNKINPAEFEVSDINKTSVCPLARVMRQELKKRGIKNVKVVYSKEPAISPKCGMEEILSEKTKPDSENQRTGRKPRQVPGSCAFCPSAAGLIIASEVIKDLTGIYNPM